MTRRRMRARSATWLREHGQGEAAIEALWGLIVRPTLNLDPEDASLAQAAQVFQVGLLRDTAAGDIGYARAPCPRSTTWRRGARWSAPVSTSACAMAPPASRGGDGLLIEISGAPTVSADVVILAVPPDRAARLLPRRGGTGADRLAGSAARRSSTSTWFTIAE